MNRISWKEIMLGTIAGLSILTSPAVGKMSSSLEVSVVHTDNRGPSSLNSSQEALNSGPGSMKGGREEGDHTGRRDRDAMVVAQAGDDVRQDDRRADRREDRRLDRREDRRADRQLDRREDRREDRQFDRREDGREDRRFERREDHRSNTGGELRGLDRADHVAGEHGREGRENARMMQMDRPNRPERMERMERTERPERGGRH